MTLNEWLALNDIIGELKKGDLFPFLDDDETVTHLLDDKYGYKTMFTKTAIKPVQLIAKGIKKIYSEKWLNLIKLSQRGDDIFLSSKHVVSESETVNEVTTTQSDNLNKVSAYDSDEMVNNDSNTSNNTGNRDNSLNNDRVIEKFNFNQAHYNLSLADKNNIIEVVLSDIVNEITLSIY